jgi:positive regulator of sigma E activity
MAAAGGDMTIVFLVSFLAGSLFAAAMAFAVLAERRGKTDIIPIILVFMVGVAVFWLIVRWAKSMRRKRWINP